MPGLIRGLAEAYQRLKDNRFPEPLDADPPRPAELYVSNLVRRTLSHLVARTDTGDVLLRCNADGRLWVQSVTALGNSLDTWEGTAGDSWTSHQFPAESMGVAVAAATNDLHVAFSADGSTYTDTATVRAGESASFALAVSHVRVKNASAGSNAGYRVWAEYSV